MSDGDKTTHLTPIWCREAPFFGSLTMNFHAETAPLNTSFVLSTHFPSPCGNGGDDMSSPPRGSSLPPLPPCYQIPKIRQPVGSQSFIPGASLPQSISQPSPVFSFGAYPPMRPTTSGASGSSLPPENVHRRGNSDSVLDSLMPQSGMWSMHPEPIEMPVGVMESKGGRKAKKSREEAANEMDVYFSTAYEELNNVSDGDDVDIISGDWENGGRATSGVKRRAGKEIAPSLDYNLNGNPGCFDSPELPPSPAIVPRVFSESQMEVIMGCEKLKGLAVSNPKLAKRILANRVSAARSKERKARYMNELEVRVNALQKEAARLSANTMLLEKSRSALVEENSQLRIRVQGMEDQAKLREALLNQLTGEVQRLRVAAGEVMQNLSGYDRSNTRSLDADMFQQLNINQEPQISLGFD